ncbi:TPA: hypothetical protein ACGOXG_000093 [Streptococcus suis]
MIRDDLNSFYQKVAEGAERERIENRKQLHEDLKVIREKTEKRIQAQQSIIDKVSELYVADEQRERQKLLEKQKQDIIAKAEEEAERTLGVKTEKTKKLDDAWRSLARELGPKEW